MKKQLLLICLLSLTVAFLPVRAYEMPPPEDYHDYSNYNPEAMKDEGIVEEYDMPPPPEMPDQSRLLELVNEVNEVLLALMEEVEQYHNRNLKSAVSKLDRCVELFTDAMNESNDGRPDSCEEGLRYGFKVFSKAISILEQRQCKEVVTRKCIPQEIGQKYIPELKELYVELEEEVFRDENEDGSPDVCKYWEEWNPEDHRAPDKYDGSDLH